MRDKAILETLFSTGLRVSELVSLDRKKFDSINNHDDLEVSVTGKGNYTRTVFFSKRAVYWLKEYLKIRIDNKEPLFINIFNTHNSNDRFSTRGVERIVKEYAVKAELPPFVTPHTTRHSYATDLMNRGVDLRAVQEFLGHRNIMTTQIYTHVTNARLREIHRQCYNERI